MTHLLLWDASVFVVSDPIALLFRTVCTMKQRSVSSKPLFSAKMQKNETSHLSDNKMILVASLLF